MNSSCAFQSADVGKDTSSITNRRTNDRTIEVGFKQGFNSNQQGKIVLRGATPFHIHAINKM